MVRHKWGSSTGDGRGGGSMGKGALDQRKGHEAAPRQTRWQRKRQKEVLEGSGVAAERSGTGRKYLKRWLFNGAA